MLKFDFSSKEYEYFLEKCPFTDEEREIIALKRRGKSNVYISLMLCMSERTLSRRLKSIGNKIAKELA